MPRWRRLNMAAAIATVVTVAYYLEDSRHAIFVQADAVQKNNVTITIIIIISILTIVNIMS